MGLEAKCKAAINGQTAEGKLQLEGAEVRFGASPKLKIPIRDLTGMEAEQGQLILRWPGGAASFTLGPQAERWLQKIRHPPSRLDKLGVTDGMSVSVVGLSDAEFLDELRTRVPKLSGPAAKEVDLVFVGVATVADLGRLEKLGGSIKSSGAVWTVYPKGVKTLTQAMVMEAAKAAGLVDTKVAAFSESHSALKWVIPVRSRGK